MSYIPKEGDIKLTCSEKGCGKEFYFSKEQQEKFASKTPPWKTPKRCYSCHMLKKSSVKKSS